MYYLFFRNCFFSATLISILFKNLWQNSLRLWFPHPFSGPSSGTADSPQRQAERASPEWGAADGRGARTLSPACPAGRAAAGSAAGAAHWPWAPSLAAAFAAAAALPLSLQDLCRGGVRNDLPGVFLGGDATHVQNFPGQHPPHDTPG